MKSKWFNGLTFEGTEMEAILCAKEHFLKKDIAFHKVAKHISVLKRHEVSFDRLTLRLEKIFALGRDSSSKKSCFYRYGMRGGYEKFNEKNRKCTTLKKDIETLHGKEYADEYFRGRGSSKENFISRHGAELGARKWEEYKVKRAKTYERKHEEGYEFKKYTEQYYVDLYGEEEGRRIHKGKIEKQRYAVSLQRYLDEYGDAGAEICRSIKDNTSLSSYIGRLGKEDGTMAYVRHCDNMKVSFKQRAIDECGDDWEEAYRVRCEAHFVPSKMECYVKKYGEIDGKRRYENYWLKQSYINRNSVVSDQSTQLFDMISNIIPKFTQYGGNNGEVGIALTESEREKSGRYYFKLDSLYENKIIEYNGDVFHGNPKFYTSEEKCHPYIATLTAGELWRRDAIRYGILANRGYTTMVVWESEFKESKTEVLEKCIRFLTA